MRRNERLEEMASDPNWQVRLAVVNDPEVTTGMLRKLAKDPSYPVALEASKRIIFLIPKRHRRLKRAS